MQVSTEILIAQPKAHIWSLISSIADSQKMISSIKQIEILDQPTTGLIGLKWCETREMFGKDATEVMWITEAVAQQYYCTRAESHGSVYVTRLAISEQGAATLLSMTFRAEPRTLLAKVFTVLMGRFMCKSLKKALDKDLTDIKLYAESVKV